MKEGHKMVASIIKHNGDRDRLLRWLNHLPMKYPEYRIAGAPKGEVFMWTARIGLVRSSREVLI